MLANTVAVDKRFGIHARNAAFLGIGGDRVAIGLRSGDPFSGAKPFDRDRSGMLFAAWQDRGG
jgi:hypothetical protein